MSPKISVIVPVYNVEKYLNRCLQSLLNQTLTDIEIILVDDGSTDSSPCICDSYAQKNKNISVIHKKNEGLGMACNSGLALAKGEYIAFLDSDDWVDADMYMAMYIKAEKYHADMVFTGLRRVTDTGESYLMSQASNFNIYNTQNKINEFMLNMIASAPQVRLERIVPMSAKVVLYNHSLIEKNKVLFESERKFVSEDLLFNLDNLIHANCVLELAETYYNYFCNTTSLSSVLRTDRFEKALELRTEIIRRYDRVINGLRIRVDRMFIGYARVAICQICLNTSLKIQIKRKYLKDICKHIIWNEIKLSYPIQMMPFPHKLFLFNVLHKNYILIYLLTKFRR